MPTARPQASAGTIGVPLMTSWEVRQPTRAITPPTERSIPAVRITPSFPLATTTRMVDCLKHADDVLQGEKILVQE